MPDSFQINGTFNLDECQINAGYLLSTSSLSCLFGQLKSGRLHFLDQWRSKSFVQLTRSPSELGKTKRVACRRLQQPSLRRFPTFRGLRGSRWKTREAGVSLLLEEMRSWLWCLWQQCEYCGHTLGFTDHPGYRVSSGAARKQGFVLLACSSLNLDIPPVFIGRLVFNRYMWIHPLLPPQPPFLHFFCTAENHRLDF